MNAETVIKAMQSLASEEKALHLSRFFKTGSGEYGEGDLFLGIAVPDTRKVAKTYQELPLEEVEKLLQSPWHEIRLCGLTWEFIIRNDFSDTFNLAEYFISHPHDLIHKAVGWMLREVGKRNREALTDFLERHAAKLPRTTLRYAIEHYPESQRQAFLRMKKSKGEK